jgi:predicted glycosyltransferase
MPRYLFSSHDGFGLGHTRRNSLIAHALLERDEAAEVVLVTGLASNRSWLRHPRLRAVEVPGLVKDATGGYRHPTMSVRAAVARRAAVFAELVDTFAPDVVVVDRHPYGTFGELRRGLLRARLRGAALVLGLRDVLDEPEQVSGELDGGSWEGVREIYTDVLVYGSLDICDHQSEYGLPVEPRYCGWVAPPAPAPAEVDSRLLIVAAGGGADGRAVYRLGADLTLERPDWHATILTGPFAAGDQGGGGRVEHVVDPPDPLVYLARAGAVVEMAGYNSTVEALVSGVRPILVPRRAPRREQAIRAQRLMSLGLADMVDAEAGAAEVAWLLDKPRRLEPGALERAGVRLDGARAAAEHIASLAWVTA